MCFESRNFHFYIIFGDTIPGQTPWMTAKWNKDIAPVLQSLLQKSPNFDKTGLGTLQYSPRPNTVYLDPMKFGKLNWSEKSHQKWTLANCTDGRLFVHMDCWTPMRTVCAKLHTPPDIYLGIWNERHLPAKLKLQFDLFMVIAIAVDLNIDPTDTVLALSEKLKAKKTIYKTRYWAGKRETDKTWEFSKSIQDTSSLGIYKKNEILSLHDIPFTGLEFEPYWKIINHP